MGTPARSHGPTLVADLSKRVDDVRLVSRVEFKSNFRPWRR